MIACGFFESAVKVCSVTTTNATRSSADSQGKKIEKLKRQKELHLQVDLELN
jgi:hypothetical protein